MKFSKLSISVLITILLLGVTCMNVFGFLGFGNSEKWKEEAQLSDGRIIIIERETLHERGGDEWASNRSGTKPKERRIRFVRPDGSRRTIEWRSTKKSPGQWPEKPLILDIEFGQPVIFSIVAISDAYEIYSKYIYRNNIWIEEALPETFEERPTNLFIRDGRGMPKFVDLETKRKGNAEIGYRRSLQHVGPTRQVLIN
jgi:hypothetical protein